MEQQIEPAVEIDRDPLLREVDFPHAGTWFPYGFPVRVRSNSLTILDAAEQSWGSFPQRFDHEPLEVHLGVAGDSEGPLPPQPVFRTRRHLLTIAGDAEHFAVCDFEAGYAFGWLTPRALRDLAAVRYFYLDTMGYSLVSERYLAGVHGACVSWQGKGVLLCGESQAGKSTLAYGCAREGFAYTSDDGSFLLRGAAGRKVTGNPHTIRFRPSAKTLFPELGTLRAVQRANGKMAIEVPTRSLHLPATAAEAEIECLVFLNRQPVSQVRISPFPREVARQQMEKAFRFGRDQTIREQREALARLLEAPAYELVYSDLDSAVSRLRILLETGS